MGIKKSHNIVISEWMFTTKVSLERSCSALNEDVFIFEIGSETTTWQDFEVWTRLVALDRSRSPQPRRWIQAPAVAVATRSAFDEVQEAAADRVENKRAS